MPALWQAAHHQASCKFTVAAKVLSSVIEALQRNQWTHKRMLMVTPSHNSHTLLIHTLHNLSQMGTARVL